MKPKWVIAAIGLLVGGCNVATYLPRNERLFAGSKIQIQPDSGVTRAEISKVKDQLEDLDRLKPNSKILGFPLKVWLYYVMGEPRRENDFRSWFRRKFGQPPVVASVKAVSSNQVIMAGFLNNEGFFRSSVRGSVEEQKNYWTRAVYQVQLRPRYYIDSVVFLTDSTPIRKALGRIAEKTFLKKGDPYRFEIIKAEQERIGQLLKQEGYYYFLPDYVTFLADSNGRKGVRLYVALKPDMPPGAEIAYYVRNIYIYPGYSLSTRWPAVDTNQQHASVYHGLRIVDTARIYKPQFFEDIVSLRPHIRYSSRAQDLTLSRFINVGAFKFVRNQFAPSFQGDTAVLDVHYYLTPHPKKSLRLELAGVTKSNNLAGSQMTVSWRNRNALHWAELLAVNVNGGVEFQIGGGSQGVTNYRYGMDITLTWPRLVAPFRIRYDRLQALPKMVVNAGYETIVRNQLYNLNSFRTSYTYAWRVGLKAEHTLQPLGVTFVRTSNFGKRFFDLLASPQFGQYVSILLSDQLILNASYSYSVKSSPQTSSPHTFMFTGTIEPAGNLAGLIKRDTSEFGYKVIFDVPFSQYIRMDIDNRHYIRISPGLTWASRVFAGVGLPYGNSGQLPFIKQYFVGGSNSIRAFRPRTVGPGTFSRSKSGEALFFQDGGGDIKLEFNTELRSKFGKYLQGAIFFDVGNVWMFSDADTYGPGSTFSSTFWKELAVGTGLGLRLDLSYFVLRADLAFPLRKPWLSDGERWLTISQLSFARSEWRKENLILTIAIGYPF